MLLLHLSMTNCFISTFEIRSPLKVWKSYLDQTEDLAKRRITVAEKAQADVADKAKTVKSCKISTFKKVNDLTN